MKREEWNWYGAWLVDWFTCDRDESGGWVAFDIWAKAYREANPELLEVSDFELIEKHYTKAMQPVFDSWVFFVWQFLQWPMSCIHQIVWRIKWKFFGEF
ncbi:hypothetical protein Q5692_38060 [Microcoleus sp. C2C3]|uniref:hypothetical protein n=1 Tax=unclassified Microcoleus TaxID=2642155 RepID=UPI002FD47424